MPSRESSPCITTARTSPFALIEVVFLGIAVALICSYKSEIGDESILAQEFHLKEFLWDICHGVTTGLAVFFASLACCAALHRELQYINGCVGTWMSNKGIRRRQLQNEDWRLPKVTQSINFSVLLALGIKAAVILLVFNVLVPFLVLKASRQSAVQSLSIFMLDSWHRILYMAQTQPWWPSVTPSLSLELMSETWHETLHNASHVLRSLITVDIAEHVEEVLIQTWRAARVIIILAFHLLVPPVATLLAIIWKALCLAHLQGTILFPWMPYTYWVGQISVKYCYARLRIGYGLVAELPHDVLHPWILLSAFALIVMAPVFASEALILKQNIGGVTLPLLISTLAANHVTSLLVFDVVRVVSSKQLNTTDNPYDTLSLITRIGEARSAASYFRAFQIMTALGIALVVVFASNMSRPSEKVPDDPVACPPCAPRKHGRELRSPSENSVTRKSTLERSARMPEIRETEEEMGIGSENMRYPPSHRLPQDDSDVSPVDQGGKSSNIDDSSVDPEGCEEGGSAEFSDGSSSPSVASPPRSEQNTSPQPQTKRSEVASGTGNLEKALMPANRRRATMPLNRHDHPFLRSEYRTSEGSTSSEPSALLGFKPVQEMVSHIPHGPRPSVRPR